MKKISLFLMAILLSSSLVWAHGDDEDHSKVRHFVSPEFNLMEVTRTSVMTGTFKEMSVLVEKNADKKKPGYTGWIVKNGEKLPFAISYKNKKMHGDFNGNKFTYLNVDIKKQRYTFKTDKGQAKVSYFFETKEGHHQKNPLFIIKNNKRNYLVRLEGECCVGHGLYYATVLYGLTTFDEITERSQKPEARGKNKKETEDHKH